MSQHGCPERLSNRSKGFQEDGGTSTMEVFVETLTGTAFEMTVSPSDTIFAIKSKICRVEGIPVAQQHLVYKLREVEDGMSLGALGIGAGARLRLVLALRGGPVCTRRLPPPPLPARHHHNNNREEEWGPGAGRARGGGGCRVTVLVFRDGERVNMLRVRENPDGTYTPLERAKYSSPASSSESRSGEGYEASAPHSPEAEHNAVTLGKMAELRARMRSLSLRRGTATHHDTDDIEDTPQEIQKTRSEETLSFPRAFDECVPGCECECAGAGAGCDALCDCAHAYALLPPIGSRTNSELSIQEAAESEGLQLSEALAGAVLCGSELDERAILQELGDGLPRDSPLAEELATVPAECGALVGGGAWREWRRGFGSHSQLSAAHARSASSLHARAPRPPAPAPPPAPLSDALFSASTSDLERLTRNRLLPALSRHRNREHLHLSDERLDAPPPPPPPPPAQPPQPPRRARIDKIAEIDAKHTSDFGDVKAGEQPKLTKKVRVRCGWCRRRLSIATQHTCRCGAHFCAPHRYAEVHGCLYDYKALAPREPPPPAAPKLPPI